MLSLSNKRILLGITGGIAAYKCAELTRLFIKAGAEVRVVMTQSATEFITPLTLQALSGNRVHLDLLDPEAEAAMGHIELARWADLVLVAPATANSIARITHGEADDILTTLVLATPAPIAIAPAMNQGMWADAQTQANIAALDARGYTLIGPGLGEQACGDVGLGRLSEPEEIVIACAALFDTGVLAGRHVVITGGPTREALDPVRYISNHSSGKMGYALAQAAVDAGAVTTLVSGPVSLDPPEHAKCHRVESAQEMLEACLDLVADCDIFIACAAVADYRPAQIEGQKIKKGAEEISLQLVKNPDIVNAVAAGERAPFTVGFAAETQNVLGYARDKMQRKGLNMIIANDVSDHGIGFNSDENEVTVLWETGEQALSRAGKPAIARQIMDLIAKATKN